MSSESCSDGIACDLEEDIMSLLNYDLSGGSLCSGEDSDDLTAEAFAPSRERPPSTGGSIFDPPGARHEGLDDCMVGGSERRCGKRPSADLMRLDEAAPRKHRGGPWSELPPRGLFLPPAAAASHSPAVGGPTVAPHARGPGSLLEAAVSGVAVGDDAGRCSAVSRRSERSGGGSGRATTPTTATLSSGRRGASLCRDAGGDRRRREPSQTSRCAEARPDRGDRGRRQHQHHHQQQHPQTAPRHGSPASRVSRRDDRDRRDRDGRDRRRGACDRDPDGRGRAAGRRSGTSLGSGSSSPRCRDCSDSSSPGRASPRRLSGYAVVPEGGGEFRRRSSRDDGCSRRERRASRYHRSRGAGCGYAALCPMMAREQIAEVFETGRRIVSDFAKDRGFKAPADSPWARVLSFGAPARVGPDCEGRVTWDELLATGPELRAIFENRPRAAALAAAAREAVLRTEGLVDALGSADEVLSWFKMHAAAGLPLLPGDPIFATASAVLDNIRSKLTPLLLCRRVGESRSVEDLLRRARPADMVDPLTLTLIMLLRISKAVRNARRAVDASHVDPGDVVAGYVPGGCTAGIINYVDGHVRGCCNPACRIYASCAVGSVNAHGKYFYCNSMF